MLDYSILPLFSPIEKEKRWKLVCYYEHDDEISSFQLLKFILNCILEKIDYHFQEIVLNNDFRLDNQEFSILQFLAELFIDK